MNTTQIPSQEPASQSASSPRQRPRVLVVEDDHATQTAMRMLLEHYDYEVFHARTVAEAIPLLEHRPRYVFLDLMLPDADGAAVLEHIRRHDLRITVAVITGTSDPERIRRVQQLQPDLFLRKPLDFLALIGQLKRYED